MNEPMRLRDGDGAARQLMAGAVLHVPNAARRRALELTSAAATLGAGTTAAAASASLLKSFVVCVCLGAAGGGVMSLAASETFSRLDAAASGNSQRAPSRAPNQAPAAPAAVEAAEVASDETKVVEPPSSTEPAPAEALAKDAHGRSRSQARDAASAPSQVTEAPSESRRSASLFEEQRIIESARASVARGDVHGALTLLDNYDRAYAPKQFGPEALALRIEALRNSGQLDAARSLADNFEQRYPHHPLLARVRGLVQR